MTRKRAYEFANRNPKYLGYVSSFPECLPRLIWRDTATYIFTKGIENITVASTPNGEYDIVITFGTWVPPRALPTILQRWIEATKNIVKRPGETNKQFLNFYSFIERDDGTVSNIRKYVDLLLIKYDESERTLYTKGYVKERSDVVIPLSDVPKFIDMLEKANETRVVLIENIPRIFDNMPDMMAKAKFGYLMLKCVKSIIYEPSKNWLDDEYNITIKFDCERGSGYYFDLIAIMKEWLRCIGKETCRNVLGKNGGFLLHFHSAIENNNKLTDVKLVYDLLPTKFDNETQTLLAKGNIAESLEITKRVNQRYFMPWLRRFE